VRELSFNIAVLFFSALFYLPLDGGDVAGGDREGENFLANFI
jgi:hypothetical protein